MIGLPQKRKYLMEVLPSFLLSPFYELINIATFDFSIEWVGSVIS
jgi:hypothetical protein